MGRAAREWRFCQRPRHFKRWQELAGHRRGPPSGEVWQGKGQSQRGVDPEGMGGLPQGQAAISIGGGLSFTLATGIPLWVLFLIA